MTHVQETWLFYMWHDLFVRVTQLSHVCDTSEEAMVQSEMRLMRMEHKLFTRFMTHWHVTWLVYTWHDSFICVKWVMRQWRNQGRASCKCDTSCLHVTRLIYTWHDSWLVHMWHDPCICVTRVIRQRRKQGRASCIRDVICLHGARLIYTWHDSSIRDMTHSYVWHDSRGNGTIRAVP
jgi:hypothetical protein